MLDVRSVYVQAAVLLSVIVVVCIFWVKIFVKPSLFLVRRMRVNEENRDDVMGNETYVCSLEGLV